ncbi:hypothetical protein ACWCPV_23865, partial [Streptomyces tubercidicus]
GRVCCPGGVTGPVKWSGGDCSLVGRFCDQAVAALEPDWPEEQLPALGTACETAARLALACVVAPVTPGAAPSPGSVRAQRSRRELEAEMVVRLVRGAFARLPAGGRTADVWPGEQC